MEQHDEMLCLVMGLIFLLVGGEAVYHGVGVTSDSWYVGYIFLAAGVLSLLGASGFTVRTVKGMLPDKKGDQKTKEAYVSQQKWIQRQSWYRGPKRRI